MDKKHIDLKLLILPVLALLITLLIYEKLPAVIPTHFDVQGLPDEMGPRSMIWMMPGSLFFAALVLILTPILDPRKRNYVKFRRPYRIIAQITELFLFLMYLWMLGQIFGFSPLPSEMLMPVMTGMLLLILGNLMPKIRQNYLVGVKTVWAFDDPDNWNKTNRFGGYCLCIGGVILLFTGFIPLQFRSGLILSTILGSVLLPYVYSWLIFHKKEKEHRQNAENQGTDENLRDEKGGGSSRSDL